MYGYLNEIIKQYIIDRHGENTWKAVAKQGKLKEEFGEEEKYDDTLTQNILAAAVAQLGFQKETLLKLIGEYLFEFIKKFGYDEIIRNLAHNILEFIQNLDFIQCYFKEEYQDIITPSFHCDEDSVSDRMVLHYFSHRPGYHSIVEGFVTNAAKCLYKMDLNIDVISITTESVSADNGFREHVVFNIIAKRILETMDDSPPTFVAQTKKHGERQILKDDVDAVRRKLEQIKRELGEEALPVNKFRSARAKWKAIAKISLLSRGFVPNYPDAISINPRMFIEVFPYHVIFDSTMNVHQSGIKIQQLMPSIRNRSADLKDFFKLRFPRFTDLSFENMKKFIMTPIILELRRERMSKEWTRRPPLMIKGQMFTLRDKGFLFFVATPYVRCWADLEVRGMKMADLPMWDATRDFLLTDVAYRVGTGKYYGHFLMESGILAQDGHFSTSGTVSEGDEKGMLEAEGKGSFPARSRWNMLQREMDNERVKNDCLYHAFLPRPVAHMVRNGIIPPGEMFADVSALFCDIVHFIQLVANCQPRDVVGVLNSLTTRFDRVTKVHDTFRVESIGDACVIISGAPEKVPNHAERIANTALGMMYLSQEVASPLYGEKIQIRIGMHTGSMLCGVVGTKLPRFIVLGETAVVASKMESHGVPGKIHISPSTYSAIKTRGFTIEERGKTELRGYGALNTYFLLANEHATDDDLCGRPRIGTQEISFINEGKEEKPSFDKKNKKAVQTPSSGKMMTEFADLDIDKSNNILGRGGGFINLSSKVYYKKTPGIECWLLFKKSSRLNMDNVIF